MSKEYPLFPELSEQGQKEAEHLLNSFKEKIKNVVEELLGEVYCNLIPHIESDSWINFRNDLMDGFRDYDNRLVQNEYDFKKIRQQIYKEYRDEIIKDLNKDLIEENEKLKADNERLYESARNRNYF